MKDMKDMKTGVGVVQGTRSGAGKLFAVGATPGIVFNHRNTVGTQREAVLDRSEPDLPLHCVVALSLLPRSHNTTRP